MNRLKVTRIGLEMTISMAGWRKSGRASQNRQAARQMAPLSNGLHRPTEFMHWLLHGFPEGK